MSEVKPQQNEPKSRSGPSSGSFKVARVQVQELGAVASPHVFEAPAADLLSDELLVERVLGKEPELYDVLGRRIVSRLYRLARGITGNVRETEDVVRGALIGAYANLSSYDRHLRFGDWVSRITIHGALVRLERPNRASQRVKRPAQDLVRQLEDAVDELPESFRVAFTLCSLDEMPVHDAAETLGISPNLLMLHAFRARLQVRRQLGTRSDDAEARAFGLELNTALQLVGDALARVGITAR
ncbi:MAG TPA: sigma factor-like helix-turn-helix DNA-binding protein [Polyangiaceae bacterium]|nr:sigma factor-like helix-turn-helix DNA-binding protein [Polyangiaceae bacterium]